MNLSPLRPLLILRSALLTAIVLSALPASALDVVKTWVGAGNANFCNPPNWSGGTEHFFAVDAVTFDDTSLNTTVNLSGKVQPSSVVIAGDGSYIFNGTGGIGGVGSLTKQGSGMLTLNTSNAYAGKTKVSGGPLVLGVNGRLTGRRWMELDQGTTFDVSAITAGYTPGGIIDQRVLSGQGATRGLITVNNAGVIKPGATSNENDLATAGDGIGQLAFANDLVLSAAAAVGAPQALSCNSAGDTQRCRNRTQAGGTTAQNITDSI